MKTKDIAFMSLLTAMALIVFVIESQIPPLVPVPGVKLGLANIITLTAMVLLDRKKAGIILAMRIFLGSIFAGAFSAILFSAAGGILAYVIMCLLINVFSEKNIWIVSAFAALGHNIGQFAMCMIVVKTPGIIVYAPVLIISGLITGIFTGFGAMYLIKALNKVRQ